MEIKHDTDTYKLACPGSTAQQLAGLVSCLREQLPDLCGIYLHGSLAMGCFNPARSDLDVLVISKDALSLELCPKLTTAILDISGQPHPLEISMLSQADLNPWRHPCPYQFHFSEDWRARFMNALRTGTMPWDSGFRIDPDLAAHITITKHYGLCLYGLPIDEVFPDIPPEDYLNSIRQDVLDALGNVVNNPVYGILNCCRVLAFIQQDLVCSKREGGLWALQRLPDDLQPVVQQALDIYSGKLQDSGFDDPSLDSFVAHVKPQLTNKDSFA